jgi:hypothetical protein
VIQSYCVSPSHHSLSTVSIFTADYTFVIYSLFFTAALDVMGLEAGEVWGRQWVKVLALVHEGITNGYDSDKLIGGDSAEGSAARTRVMVSLENIVDGVRPG